MENKPNVDLSEIPEPFKGFLKIGQQEKEIGAMSGTKMSMEDMVFLMAIFMIASD